MQHRYVLGISSSIYFYMLTTLLTVFLPESCRIHTLSNWFFVLFSHVGMQAANVRLRPKDSVVEGQKLRAIVAQKPETSWKRPAFIASIFTKENIGRLYPILASIFKVRAFICNESISVEIGFPRSCHCMIVLNNYLSPWRFLSSSNICMCSRDCMKCTEFSVLARANAWTLLF